MNITPYAFSILGEKYLGSEELQQIKEQRKREQGFDFVYLAEAAKGWLHYHGYAIGSSSLREGLESEFSEVREYAESILQEVESNECLAESLTSSNSWIREAALRKIKKETK